MNPTLCVMACKFVAFMDASAMASLAPAAEQEQQIRNTAKICKIAHKVCEFSSPGAQLTMYAKSAHDHFTQYRGMRTVQGF